MPHDRSALYHHTPDHYTWLAQYTRQHSDELPLVWGHDHDGAYRQLPLDDPSIAYVLLLTPDGPTLWHHHVLLFGSAASVWAYNRFGDMLSAIARTIACIPVVHYVDDYGSIEPSGSAASGFDTLRIHQLHPRIPHKDFQETTASQLSPDPRSHHRV